MKWQVLKLALVSLLIGMLFQDRSYAFPDTIRHGYVNCTSCHFSPAGGGLMSNYGRSLSSELLSTWSRPKEELPLHGLVELPEKVSENIFLGGDARYISRKSESEITTINEGFWMQTQLRFGASYKKWKAAIAIGKLENPRASQEVKWVGPEFFASWSPLEEMHFRFGRFEPIYGLRLPDHNLWIKSEIGIAPWLERDGAEWIYEGEAQFLSLSGYQSTSKMDPTFQTTGQSLSFNQILGERQRIGFSAFRREGQGQRSKAFTIQTMVAFSEKAYGMIEASRIWTGESRKDVGFSRIGYEIFKGFTPFVQGQWKKGGPTQNQFSSKFGGGISWLPRPHFELVGTHERTKTPTGSVQDTTFLFHYYL